MKKLNIIIEAPLLQKDFKRFGISYLSKNFQIVIIDISYLTKKKIYQELKQDEYIIKDEDSFKINTIKSIRDLINFIKKNKNEFCIDYLGDIPINQILRYVLFLFDFKLIKTSHGMLPNKPLSIRNYKYFLLKMLNLSHWINFLFNKIKFNRWYIYMISCKKAEKIRNSNYILHTYTFDYATYLEFEKNNSKKDNNNLKKKLSAVFIDQNLADNTDFLITKHKTVKREIYYNELKLFFDSLDSNKWNIKIALHPKNEIKNIQKYFVDYKITNNSTISEVKNSDIIFCHYSTALNFAYLYKKPIIVIYINDMKDKHYFQRYMNALCDYHKIIPLNISEFKDSDIDINKYSNTSKYEDYINDFIKHPKSKNNYIWEEFTNFLISHYKQ